MFGRFSAGPLINRIGQVSDGVIEEEAVVSVSTARVVCANYAAIVHDFPQIFGPAALAKRPRAGCAACHQSGRLCRQAINDWLIENSAFVSKQQSLPNPVNGPISLGSVERTAYRPPVYGRGVVVPVDVPAGEDEAGFLDLKGAGVSPDMTPSHAPYSSGLEYLGQAIADFFYGWLVDTVFARTCPGYHVVPVYAVLDYGFDIIDGWHGTAPAGLHVRRAHARPVPRSYLPEAGSDRERLMLHAEMLLRIFGLTTAGLFFRLEETSKGTELWYNGQPVMPQSQSEYDQAARIADLIQTHGAEGLEALNMQLTSVGSWTEKSLEMYDFGHVRGVDEFKNPISNPIRNGVLSVGRILTPDSSAFVQPRRDIAIDSDLGSRRSVNAFGFYAAQAGRSQSNPLDQRAVETMLRIGRLKVLKRRFDWARRAAVDVRNRHSELPTNTCVNQRTKHASREAQV